MIAQFVSPDGPRAHHFVADKHSDHYECELCKKRVSRIDYFRDGPKVFDHCHCTVTA